MKKKTRISIGLILVVLCIGAILLFHHKTQELDSALKFKEEYEQYNGRITDEGYTYPELQISKKNVMYYATSQEVISLLKHGTGIIYFGTPSNPWCRNAVSVLLQASESTNINRIYYLDLTKKYDVYEMKNNQVTKTKEGSRDYYEIVDLLKEYLSNYVIDNQGQAMDTKVKRIFMPFVVFVQKGKILSTREGTTSSHMNGGNGYVTLTESEIEELFNYYVDKMTMIADSSCDEAC